MAHYKFILIVLIWIRSIEAHRKKKAIMRKSNALINLHTRAALSVRQYIFHYRMSLQADGNGPNESAQMRWLIWAFVAWI